MDFIDKKIEDAFNELERKKNYLLKQIDALDETASEAIEIAEFQKKLANNLKALARKSLFYAAAGDVKSIKELYEGVNLHES